MLIITIIMANTKYFIKNFVYIQISYLIGKILSILFQLILSQYIITN